MIRAMYVAITLAAVGMFATGVASADDRNRHRDGGYSGHHHHSHNSGFVQFSFGNPYGYYGRPIYPAYSYGYYPAYPVYRPAYGYYGGCGGYGYPAYGYRGVSFGFGW